MREILLIKNGEIALKGQNRVTFEDQLIRNIRGRLKPLGEFRIRKAQSTIYIEPQSQDIDWEEAVSRMRKVFGIAMLERAAVVEEKDMEKIKEAAAEYLADVLTQARTFKVEAKRSDKTFPLDSPQICRELGGFLLSRFQPLKVDVHNPQVTVTVEVRDYGAYLHAEKIPGAGGMPAGSSGRGLLLLSGGIDSPVAGYMMAKRGVGIHAIHFAAPPYTSERAKLKVIELAKIVAEYAGPVSMCVVHFTKIQELIRDRCPEEFFTLVMRRFMMRIACRVAQHNHCDALITGESVGQVASQTMLALKCTDAVCDIPVFRPVIGMDKSEIVDIARKIGTFETSIQPYEDCCTVFTPRHPKTRPHLDQVEAAEAKLEVEALVEEAMAECLEFFKVKAEE